MSSKQDAQRGSMNPDNIQRILEDHNLVRRNLSGQKLMGAISDALYYTSTYSEAILQAVQSYFSFLRKNNLITKKQLQLNDQEYHDYDLNPTLQCFQRLNLELISLLYKVRIMIYSIDNEKDENLSASIINNQFDKNIEVLRQGGNYDALITKKRSENYEICQSLLTNLFQEYLGTKNRVYKPEQEKSSEKIVHVRRVHKKSLSDTAIDETKNNLYTLFELQPPSDFLAMITGNNSKQNILGKGFPDILNGTVASGTSPPSSQQILSGVLKSKKFSASSDQSNRKKPSINQIDYEQDKYEEMMSEINPIFHPRKKSQSFTQLVELEKNFQRETRYRSQSPKSKHQEQQQQQQQQEYYNHFFSTQVQQQVQTGNKAQNIGFKPANLGFNQNQMGVKMQNQIPQLNQQQNHITNMQNQQIPPNLNIMSMQPNMLQQTYSDPNLYQMSNEYIEQMSGAASKKPIILDESQHRYSGRLKFFDENKNYGFIIMDQDCSDIFVHYDDLQKATITKDLLKTAKLGNIIRFSFSCMSYIGKYNKSRKAVDLHMLNNPQMTNMVMSNSGEYRGGFMPELSTIKNQTVFT